MKLKKRRKSGRMRASSTHGWGARKKHISSGNRGGFGMAGTGKMAGQKKTLVTKLYGTGYFGKQGITSKSTERRKDNVMNLGDLQRNLEALKKKAGKEGVINLEKYKILGDGEIIDKVTVKAKSASKNAVEKIQKAGGKIIIKENKEKAANTEEKKEAKKE